MKKQWLLNSIIILGILVIVQFLFENISNRISNQKIDSEIVPRGRWVFAKESGLPKRSPYEIEFLGSEKMIFSMKLSGKEVFYERSFVIEDERLLIAPPLRLVTNWKIRIQDGQLFLGGFPYQQVLTFPWQLIALLIFPMGIFAFQVEKTIFVQKAGQTNDARKKTFVWWKFVSAICICLIGLVFGGFISSQVLQILFQIGFREPWFTIYLFEITTLVFIILGKFLVLRLWETRWYFLLLLSTLLGVTITPTIPLIIRMSSWLYLGEL